MKSEPNIRLPASPPLSSSDLLACVECKTLPMYVEERTEDGMEAAIQCQMDCNTVVGPAEWARNEWNRQMREQANKD